MRRIELQETFARRLPKTKVLFSLKCRTKKVSRESLCLGSFHLCISIPLQILGSPQRLFDLAGPCVTEPESRKRSFSKRKSHLDLLKL